MGRRGGRRSAPTRIAVAVVTVLVLGSCAGTDRGDRGVLTEAGAPDTVPIDTAELCAAVDQLAERPASAEAWAAVADHLGAAASAAEAAALVHAALEEGQPVPAALAAADPATAGPDATAWVTRAVATECGQELAAGTEEALAAALGVLGACEGLGSDSDREVGGSDDQVAGPEGDDTAYEDAGIGEDAEDQATSDDADLRRGLVEPPVEGVPSAVQLGEVVGLPLCTPTVAELDAGRSCVAPEARELLVGVSGRHADYSVIVDADDRVEVTGLAQVWVVTIPIEAEAAVVDALLHSAIACADEGLDDPDGLGAVDDEWTLDQSVGEAQMVALTVDWNLDRVDASNEMGIAAARRGEDLVLVSWLSPTAVTDQQGSEIIALVTAAAGW